MPLTCCEFVPGFQRGGKRRREGKEGPIPEAVEASGHEASVVLENMPPTSLELISVLRV